MNLVREPDAENLHVRFDERDVETEHDRTIQAPATERAGNKLRPIYPTAPRLDSTRPEAFLGLQALDRQARRRTIVGPRAARR